MAQNKPIQRSVRMTEMVAGYIDAYRGDGFSDKLENLVMDALLGEKERLDRLGRLDADIRAQEVKFRAVCSRLSELDRIAIRMTSVSDTVDRLVVALDSVLMSGAQHTIPCVSQDGDGSQDAAE